jgi:hypothetical protein
VQLFVIRQNNQRGGGCAGHICIISSAESGSIVMRECVLDRRRPCMANWRNYRVHRALCSRHSLRPLIRLSACDAFDGSADFDFARMPPGRSTIAADSAPPRGATAR